MATTVRNPSLGPLSSSAVWGLALVLFGVLDVAVTVYAIYGLAPESHFAYLAVLDLFGVLRPLGFFVQLLASLAVWKIGAILVLFVVYRVTPRNWRIGVPIGLATWGGSVLAWNLYATGIFHRMGLF